MKFTPREMQDNILGQLDLNKKIYRIFSYKWFEELIRKEELALLSLKKWDDPFENFFLNTQVISDTGEVGTLKEIADCWYGQCWTDNKDTDAMWRIYSPAKDGIRVQTTVGKLFRSIFDNIDNFAGLKYFIGAVEYKDKNDIISFLKNTSFSDIALGGQNDGFAKLLCIKRNEFKHESEIRILVNDVDNIGVDDCYRISFNPMAVFEEICIDPRASHDEFLKLRAEIESLGVTLPIVQSDLYKIDLPPIKL